jgi:hypothetical protein
MGSAQFSERFTGQQFVFDRCAYDAYSDEGDRPRTALLKSHGNMRERLGLPQRFRCKFLPNFE